MIYACFVSAPGTRCRCGPNTCSTHAKSAHSHAGACADVLIRLRPEALQLPSRLDGAAQRDLVGVLELAAHRQAARQTRDLDVERLDEAREIGGRGLALDVGVGGDEDLGDVLAAEASHELADVQLVGTLALHGVDHAAQHVVDALEGARTLDGAHVAGLGHHADARGVAARVGADGAHLARGVVEAMRAEVHRALHVHEGVGQTLDAGGV